MSKPFKRDQLSTSEQDPTVDKKDVEQMLLMVFSQSIVTLESLVHREQLLNILSIETVIEIVK